MPTDTPTLSIYADYVCPFCYLGRQSLARYEATRGDEVSIEWHPFDLRYHKRKSDGTIDHSVEDGKDDEYFEQARQNVERLRDEYGADAMLDLDEIPDPVDSIDAQVASAFVQREYPEQWRAFDSAIYEALWEQGRDIGDGEVLTEVAATAGLDRDVVRSALADDDLREHVQGQFIEARQRGITGVPTFEANGLSARGAVPPSQLRRLIEGE